MATMIAAFLGGAVGTAIGYGLAFVIGWTVDKIRDWRYERRYGG